jgi:Domain of unknown function (DUF4192)
MPNRPANAVHLSTPADVIAMVPSLLGFVPSESLVIICLHGPRRRVGLAMRFDLADATEVAHFAEMVDERIGVEEATAALAVVFSADAPVGADLPHAALAEGLIDQMDEILGEVVLTDGEQWWSYCCGDGTTGELIDPSTPGATAVAAAYALAGQGVLPDRDAVVRSVALALSAAEATDMRRRIAAFRRVYAGTDQPTRQDVVRVLVVRLARQLVDPRGALCTDDVAELAALCDDVVVRDEVLVRAIGSKARKTLLPVLREMVRRVPPPCDAPACAMLAWVAYADGDGVVANVMVERALATNPDYSLAELIADALYRQVPPRLLEEVMRGAARDLRHRSAAG